MSNPPSSNIKTRSSGLQRTPPSTNPPKPASASTLPMPMPTPTPTPPPSNTDMSNATHSQHEMLAKIEALTKAMEELKAESKRDRERRIEVEKAMAALINAPAPVSSASIVLETHSNDAISFSSCTPIVSPSTSTVRCPPAATTTSQNVPSTAIDVDVRSHQPQPDMLGLEYSTTSSNTQMRTHLYSNAAAAYTPDTFMYTVPPTTAPTYTSGAATPSTLTYQTASHHQGRPKLWDLPEFSGRPEDWPKFEASFRMSTQWWGYNELENLMRLQKSLSGPALESVESLLIRPENVSHVLSTLAMRFGCPQDLVRSQILKAKSLPRLSMNNFEQILPFATTVKNVCAFLNMPDTVAHLSNPTLIDELVGKLPPTQQMEWVRTANTIRPYPTLQHFSDWLNTVANTIGRCPYASVYAYNASSSSSNATRSNNNNNNRQQPDRSRQPHQKSRTQTFLHVSDTTTSCSYCRRNGHSIKQCSTFQKLAVASRWDFIKENRLCFSCLRHGHGCISCNNKQHCGVDNCQRYHHHILHETKQPISTTDIQTERPKKTNPFAKPSRYDPSSDESHSRDNRDITNVPPTATILSCRPPDIDPPLYFKIVPIKLFGPNRQIDSFALIDEGSSVSMLDEETANELGLCGKSEPLQLQWFGSHTSSQPSKIVNLHIQGVGRANKRFELHNVRTIRDIDLPVQTIRFSQLHFKSTVTPDLPTVDYVHAKPKLLIGLDNCHLGVPRQYFETTDDAPIAVNTKLGWFIYGPNRPNHSPRIARIMHCANTRAPAVDLEALDRMVREYFATENFGVTTTERQHESEDDIRARHMLDSTTKRIGNRFQSGLLWKSDNIQLPSSRVMAVNRLASIERKMRQQPAYAAKYLETINDYVNKGYARKLTEAEANVETPTTWYLPHFSVFNPHKPDKFRMVFDAAANVDGTSLNSALMTGPNLNPPLIEILFRFRIGTVGVCADIKEMYHQIVTQPSDRHSQRFLWRNQETNAIETFEMMVMTFGATCSPCVAQYVKMKNALEHQEEHPAAVKAIIEQHYVDDLVISFASTKEAIDTVSTVKQIHALGGFELRKFVSNCPTVRKALEGLSTEALSMHLDSTTGDKILGMIWNTHTDSFAFQTDFHRVHDDVISLKRKPTKREALSFLMSVYDPFGFLANFLVYAKLQLQELWTVSLGWDEPVPSEWYERWKSWLGEFEVVKRCRVPRCYSSILSQCRDLQLHVFADASEMAYAAVAYWRIYSPDHCQISFVAGKTKCAPLKAMSIPRLELQAAVLATRLKKIIVSCHGIAVNKIVFWTDSQTVLQWIKSDHRRYKPFVAHRVSEILDESDQSCWRWISTKLNVADDATRAQATPKYELNSRWLNGPPFLSTEETDWPVPEPSCKSAPQQTLELRSRFLITKIQGSQHSPIMIYDRFSQYYRLIRALAWVFRFARNSSASFRSRRPRIMGELTSKEIDDAEVVLFRAVQHEGFPQEVADLQAAVAVSHQSHLYQLQPYLDDNQVMRVAGRLDAAPHLTIAAKRPIILPKDHVVSTLIVTHHHRLMKHQQQEAVICAVRQRFWVPHLRSLVKRAKSSCMLCKLRSAKPNVPVMGPLPADRLTPNLRPFAYTGLDFFGPVYVTVGRSREKRWVSLFTCMTIRAIHLELAADLSTDACILCIRNFCNIRGTPAKIRSDNGTNFVGASREFRNCVDMFDQNALTAELTTKGIEWCFNCPANPEAGGAWERLVQSTKKVLAITLREVAPKVETLRSLLFEAANIVNSRPLTHVPVTVDEPEPLTPNHFLIGSISSTQTPREFDKKALFLRKQWRIAQQLKNHFWHRWTLEYLPDLTRRTKWNKVAQPLAIGDLVFVCDEALPRSQWCRGIIAEVVQGKDGCIRTATVKTQTGTLRRPVSRLAVLDVGESPASLDSRGEEC